MWTFKFPAHRPVLEVRRSWQLWGGCRGYRPLLRVSMEVVGTVALGLSSSHLCPLPLLTFVASTLPVKAWSSLHQEAESKETLSCEARRVVQRRAEAHWKVICHRKAVLKYLPPGQPCSELTFFFPNAPLSLDRRSPSRSAWDSSSPQLELQLPLFWKLHGDLLHLRQGGSTGYFYVYSFVGSGMHLPQHTCGGQRAACGSQFSPSAL